MSISLVARRHGIAPNQLFRRRRLYVENLSACFRWADDAIAEPAFFNELGTSGQ